MVNHTLKYAGSWGFHFNSMGHCAQASAPSMARNAWLVQRIMLLCLSLLISDPFL